MKSFASLAVLVVVAAAPAPAQVVKPATPATRPVAPKTAATKPPMPAVKPPSLRSQADLVGNAAGAAPAQTVEEMQVELAALKARMKTTTGLGVEDMLAMQRMMVKKNQLETMISNAMKAGEETPSELVSALKAS